MELRQLRAFEAILAHGTVTGAADALGIAPSSASAQLRRLEDALGVALFARMPRGMRLTEAGERLAGWSRRLLDQAEQATTEVRGASRPLRLGALETIAATHGPGIVRRVPGEAELRSSVSRAELLEGVSSGVLDAALLLDRGGELGGLGFGVPAAPLAFADVAEVPLVLVAAPAEHPARLLVNVEQCSFRLAAEALFGPEIQRVRAGGVAVMRAWAEQGLGRALLPEFAVAEPLRSGALVRIPCEAPPLALRLVWRSDRESLPGLRGLLYAAAA